MGHTRWTQYTACRQWENVVFSSNCCHLQWLFVRLKSNMLSSVIAMFCLLVNQSCLLPWYGTVHSRQREAARGSGRQREAARGSGTPGRATFLRLSLWAHTGSQDERHMDIDLREEQPLVCADTLGWVVMNPGIRYCMRYCVSVCVCVCVQQTELPRELSCLQPSCNIDCCYWLCLSFSTSERRLP